MHYRAFVHDPDSSKCVALKQLLNRSIAMQSISLNDAVALSSSKLLRLIASADETSSPFMNPTDKHNLFIGNKTVYIK